LVRVTIMFSNRLKKITIRVAIGIVAIFIALGFIMPTCGRFTLDMQLQQRGESLKEWKKIVEEFKTKNGRLPKSLYEACYEDVIHHNLRFALWYSQINDENRNKKNDHDALTDPNTFARMIEYQLLVGTLDWFISEKAEGAISDKQVILLIDQNGNFYTQKNFRGKK